MVRKRRVVTLVEVRHFSIEKKSHSACKGNIIKIAMLWGAAIVEVVKI